MAGRRICAGYYRRYDGKVVYVISTATIERLEDEGFRGPVRKRQRRQPDEEYDSLSPTTHTQRNSVRTTTSTGANTASM